MSDAPFSINFSSIKSQAAEMLDAPDIVEAEAPVVQEAVAPEAPVPVIEAPSVTTPEAPAVAAVEELDPETHGDRLVRVKVNGEWEVKPLKEVTASWSRTSDYTRKMQGVAEQRREAEALIAQGKAREAETQAQVQELHQLRGLLGNRQLLERYLQQFASQTNQPVAGDPNEIATVQQARDIAQYQAQQTQVSLQQLERTLSERVAQSARDIENRRETVVFTDVLNTTVRDIFKDNPLLTKVPMAEDILRYQVAKLMPKTLVEAQEAFRTVAKGMLEDLSEGFANHNKTKLAVAAKLTKARIEPPGGTGVQITPTPPAFDKKTNVMDWKSMNKTALTMMD